MGGTSDRAAPAVTVAAVTEIGPRDENQDRVSAVAGAGGWVAAVADGLGGHPRGAEAAEAAVSAMPLSVAGRDGMAGLFRAADAEVSALADGPMTFSNVRRRPMSTLAVAASLPGGGDAGVLVGWAGDTTVYLLAAVGGLLSAALVGAGHNGDFGVITRCLGHPNAEPEMRVVAAGGPGSGVAVLSDGAWAPLEANLPRGDGKAGFEIPLGCGWEAAGVAGLLLGGAAGFGLTDNASAAVACF